MCSPPIQIVSQKTILRLCLLSILVRWDLYDFATSKEPVKKPKQRVLPGSVWVPQERLQSLGDTRGNWKSLWTDFLSSTGLHGISHLEDDNALKYRLRRPAWIFAICTTAVLLIYVLVTAITEFYTFPTMTSYSVEVKKSLPFPTVTICNFSPVNITLLKQELPDPDPFFLSLSPLFDPLKSTYKSAEIRDINWTSHPFYNREMSREWFEDIAMKGMFDRCWFDGEPKPCEQIFTLIHTQLGLCYQFNSNRSNPLHTSLTGSVMNFATLIYVDQDNYMFAQDPAAGVQVKIHEQHIHPDDEKSEVIAGVGTSNYIQLTRAEYKFLPRPYTAFGDRPCLDLTARDTHVNYTSYDECTRMCLVQRVFSKCKCYSIADTEKGRRCTPKEMVTCYAAEERILKQTLDILADCDCFTPCEFRRHKTEVSTAVFPALNWIQQFWRPYLKLPLPTSALSPEVQLLLIKMRENFVEVRVFFNNLIVEKFEQLPQYSLTDVMANIGGQMGLFLGASILTLTEFGEFLILVIIKCLKWKRPQDRVFSLKGNGVVQ